MRTTRKVTMVLVMVLAVAAFLAMTAAPAVAQPGKFVEAQQLDTGIDIAVVAGLVEQTATPVPPEVDQEDGQDTPEQPEIPDDGDDQPGQPDQPDEPDEPDQPDEPDEPDTPYLPYTGGDSAGYMIAGLCVGLAGVGVLVRRRWALRRS